MDGATLRLRRRREHVARDLRNSSDSVSRITRIVPPTTPPTIAWEWSLELDAPSCMEGSLTEGDVTERTVTVLVFDSSDPELIAVIVVVMYVPWSNNEVIVI